MSLKLTRQSSHGASSTMPPFNHLVFPRARIIGGLSTNQAATAIRNLVNQHPSSIKALARAVMPITEDNLKNCSVKVRTSASPSLNRLACPCLCKTMAALLAITPNNACACGQPDHTQPPLLLKGAERERQSANPQKTRQPGVLAGCGPPRSSPFLISTCSLVSESRLMS